MWHVIIKILPIFFHFPFEYTNENMSTVGKLYFALVRNAKLREVLFAK